MAIDVAFRANLVLRSATQSAGNAFSWRAVSAHSAISRLMTFINELFLLLDINSRIGGEGVCVRFRGRVGGASVPVSVTLGYMIWTVSLGEKLGRNRFPR